MKYKKKYAKLETEDYLLELQEGGYAGRPPKFHWRMEVKLFP